MLKFKGNVSAKQIVDSTLKGRAAVSKKRKFSEFEQSQLLSQEHRSVDNEKEQESVNKFKTAAEVSFDLVKKKRIMERIEKKLESSHKEKIEKFNKGLSKLSDHFDIPRVGPG